MKSEKIFGFIPTLDITGKFTLGLVFAMCITSVLAAVFILNQQSSAFSDLMGVSNKTMHTMFEGTKEDAKKAQQSKIKNLVDLLVAISPEAVAEYEISTLTTYATVSLDDTDISYIAFVTPDGKNIVSLGDEKQVKKDYFIEKPLTIDELVLGKVVVAYNYDRLNAELASAKSYEATNMKQMEVAGDSAITTATVGITIAMTASGIIILVILVIMFRVIVIKRLSILEVNMQNIAEGEGDLRSRIEVHGHDGIDRVGHYFNLFLDKIHQAIKHVDGAAEQISHAVGQMSSITDKTSTAIMAQQSETEQVAAATNEMAATVTEVARNASEAAEAAKEADQQSSEGKVVVMSSIEFIRKLADDVENAAGVIRQLKEDSESIGVVLDVIQGIAEQTNLLALNAAIEAARAGDQGRGFAVVADEVRTLAQRTQESTTKIKTIIEQLQQGAQKAVQAMDTGRDQAQLSVEKANDTGSSLEAITEAVKTISMMNTQIASAAEEQNAVAEDINKNIAKISEHGEQTAHGANQTAIASTELSSLSSELSSLMQQFKI